MDGDTAQVILSQNRAILALLSSTKDFMEMRFAYLAITSLASTALGAFLALKISNTAHSKRARGEAIKAFMELLQKFETQCLEYWSRDYDDGCSLIEEAKIKAGHKLLRQYSDHGKFGLTDDTKKRLAAKVSALFDAATGGDFESSQRRKSRKRLQMIAMLTAEITPIMIERSFE